MSIKMWYLVRKDLDESLRNRMVMLPMIILPVVICIVMPAALIILGLQAEVYPINGADMVKKILHLYAIPSGFDTDTARLLYVLLNFTLMPMFLLIPVMVSSVVASNAVAGEKERRTLETLLYTPLSNRELIVGKVLSAFIPAMTVSLGSFILYFFTANGLFMAMRGMPVVVAPAWIPSLLLVNPALALLGLAVTILVGIKAKSQIEAQQTAGLVVLPLLALMGSQMSGILVFDWPVVAGIGAVLLVIDWFVILQVAPRFERERIIELL